jgi:hypothetical protein
MARRSTELVQADIALRRGALSNCAHNSATDFEIGPQGNSHGDKTYTKRGGCCSTPVGPSAVENTTIDAHRQATLDWKIVKSAVSQDSNPTPNKQISNRR